VQGSQLLDQPEASNIIEYIFVFPVSIESSIGNCQPAPVFNSFRLGVLTAATAATLAFNMPDHALHIPTTSYQVSVSVS
jgi:hypothetical protein